MGKLIFTTKKAQLLASFSSVIDLVTRFEKAGFNVTIRNREHNFDYELTQDGFVAGKFKLKDPPEPKLGEIDVDVSSGFASKGFVAIKLVNEVPSKLASVLFPKTNCMYGPNGATDRVRIYDVAYGFQGNDCHVKKDDQFFVFLKVSEGYSEKILTPPGCNEYGEQLSFAAGCAGAPTKTSSKELNDASRVLEVAARHALYWPAEQEARIDYARNCARLFAGIGTASDTAVQITEQCAAWAGDEQTVKDAGLDQLDDLGTLSEAEIKSLCVEQWGPGGLKLGETYYGWFKVDEPVVVEDSGPKLADGFALASEIHTAKVEWVWPGYIAKGAITMIDGLPDQGKSTLTCDIAARISAGIPFPGGGEVKPRMVVMINGEDFAPQVTIPRIQAAGGDTSKIIIWPDPGADFSPLYLPDKLSTLKELFAENDIGLIIIDPLNSHLSQKYKVENDQHMKAALQPLTNLAQAKGIPILAVRHLTKAKAGQALLAGLGSIGIIGTARAGYIVGPDPDGSGDRIFACSKMISAPKPKSLRFKIVSATVKSSDGTDIATSKIEWLGDSPHTADDLCKPKNASAGPALAAAIEFLKDQLAEGHAPAKQLLDAAVEVGLSKASIYRAKHELGVTSEKTGSGWHWVLPEPKD